ncbi:2691_t:CDS:2 [Funneliformis geosporum]|uniref:10835_t:CDS:1 n=1 Tax=Funneliformis geosporum TaxID=1117311 RepID=A0A9W4SC95_9GLOM|nr:10835_t:CDS:2 [Funneliformis geosporum]CAI2178784.1 2691_t:CDS:2 [Funneliformis geosporum]
MGKTKSVNKQTVSSFFASTKARTVNHKETKLLVPLAQTVSSKVRQTSKCISKENTLAKRASTFKPSSRSDTARRRRALIERVRAKGQKTLEETLQGLDPVKKRQKTMLSRAREIANSISFLYVSRNKTVMFVREVATRIVESSDVPISEYEAIEHIELLTKIAPKWCQFSTSKNEDDLLTIDSSVPAWKVREIIEEGVKNFQ